MSDGGNPLPGTRSAAGVASAAVTALATGWLPARSAALWFGVARPHILAIVFASTLTYGWIFSERFAPLIALVAVWDWFIVNFMNKAVDVEEDAQNGIPGAEAVRAHRRTVEQIGWLMIAVGLLAGGWLVPKLWPFRLLFTLIGLGYNYKIVPAIVGGRLGLSRLKEMYFFKNFGSSLLFTLSVFLYPLFGLELEQRYSTSALLLSIAFFIPLELTYEIIYDLRDVEGDRALRVPTYPVVHGEARARQIIWGLILGSSLPLIIGAASGLLRLREWVVVAGCVQQAILVLVFLRRGRRPSPRDCILITLIGAAQLLSYCAWVRLGLPLGS